MGAWEVMNWGYTMVESRCWWKLSGGTSVCLAEEPLDVSLDVAGEELPAVALERDTVGPNEELLKVPGHVVPADGAPDDELGVADEWRRIIAGGRELLPEEQEQRVGILPVDVHLLQELELGLKAISRPDVLQGQEDFIVFAVLLRKLRNRKT